jgi:hypothetical protein
MGPKILGHDAVDLTYLAQVRCLRLGVTKTELTLRSIHGEELFD